MKLCQCESGFEVISTQMIGLVTSYQKSHEIQGPISLQTQDLQTSLTRIILKKSSRTGHVQRSGGWKWRGRSKFINCFFCFCLRSSNDHVCVVAAMIFCFWVGSPSQQELLLSLDVEMKATNMLS